MRPAWRRRPVRAERLRHRADEACPSFPQAPRARARAGTEPLGERRPSAQPPELFCSLRELGPRLLKRLALPLKLSLSLGESCVLQRELRLRPLTGSALLDELVLDSRQRITLLLQGNGKPLRLLGLLLGLSEARLHILQ